MNHNVETLKFQGKVWATYRFISWHVSCGACLVGTRRGARPCQSPFVDYGLF